MRRLTVENEVAGQEAEDKVFRRQVFHSYGMKLRSRGIPDIDRDFYLPVREGLARDVIDELGADDDAHLAAVLLFLGGNDVIVTGNRLLGSGAATLSALFSPTSASLIFTQHLPTPQHPSLPTPQQPSSANLIAQPSIVSPSTHIRGMKQDTGWDNFSIDGLEK